MAAARPTDLYAFNDAFERGAIALACTRPRFYGRIAHELDPALTSGPLPKLLLETARVIYRETGSGPSSALIVVQRLRKREQDGGLTREQVIQASDYLDDAADAGLPDEEQATQEIIQVLKPRIHDQAIRASMTAHGQKGSMGPAQELFAKADMLGKRDITLGLKLGDATFDAIDELNALEKLPLGITDVDLRLGGGLFRGGLGIIAANTGVGKSACLSQIAGHAVKTGRFVAVATLELPAPLWSARVKASILDTPVDVLIGGDSREKNNARKRFRDMNLGPLVIKTFPAYTTTNKQIEAWLAEVEQEADREVELLVVDYGDKVGADYPPGARDKSDYLTGRLVFEGFRLLAETRKKWCWTASQAQRQKDKHKRIDDNDLADSQHKGRVANMILTLTPHGDNDEQLLIFCAKNTVGASRFEVILPTDYAYGRAVSVV